MVQHKVLVRLRATSAWHLPQLKTIGDLLNIALESYVTRHRATQKPGSHVDTPAVSEFMLVCDFRYQVPMFFAPD